VIAGAVIGAAVLVLGFALWAIRASALAEGAATAQAAQAAADAKSENAALVVANKGESDAQTVDSLNSGTF
jgi:hypothetical protein